MGQFDKLYNDRKWQRLRSAILLDHPSCVSCATRGVYTRANVVDHIVKHQGDLELFWNRDNLQSMCKQCHDGGKQRLEKSGRVAGCDADGFPLDPRHEWYKKRRVAR